jgi:hypothetical protein
MILLKKKKNQGKLGYVFSVLMITITSWMCTNIKYSWIQEISCGTEVQAEINAAYALTKDQCHIINRGILSQISTMKFFFCGEISTMKLGYLNGGYGEA